MLPITTLLQMKVLYWHLWFLEELLTYIHGIFSYHRRFFIVKRGSLDFLNVKKKNVAIIFNSVVYHI